MNIGKCDYKYINMLTLLKNRVQIWQYQRTVNLDRTKELIQNLKDNFIKYNEFCIRHPIIICKYKNNDYIIDGQHRYYALYNLMSENFITDTNIFVLYINCTSESDIWFEFNNINNIVPVPKCYIQPSDVIDTVMNNLSIKYKNLKKSTKNIIRPNANIDRIKDCCINNNILDKLNIKSADELSHLFEKLQNFYSTKPISYFANMFKLSTNNTTLNNIYNKLHSNINLLDGRKLSHFIGIFKPEYYQLWIQDLILLK